MNRSMSLRFLWLSVVLVALATSPQLAFAGAHGGGGGGFHGGGGGGFHGGGGAYHGASGYHASGGWGGGGYGYHGGYGYGYRGGYGYGWRGGYGYGWRGGYGWGGPWWGGWGCCGWGFGLSFNFGWPYYGYPYGYGYYPYSYYPYSYYPSGYSYAPGGDPNASADPSSYSQGGSDVYGDAPNYSQNGSSYAPTYGQNGSSYQYHSAQRPSAGIPQPIPNSSSLTLHNATYVAPAPANRLSRQVQAMRPEVQNVVRALRAMPPQARQRALDSGLYSNFSPQELQVVRSAAGLPPA